MDEMDWLAERFESHRTHLRRVAYQMLGSLTEADDAVQEAWLRLSRADTGGVKNLGSWLTTVIARVCLDMLRSRKTRREEPRGVHMPDPIVSRVNGTDPEHQALLADSVGLALLVVLDTLEPAERLAFVLHDMFDLPFNEIAPLLGRSPNAARLLASRARRRVRRAASVPDADLTLQQGLVGAFLAASRAGDFEALVALLDPGVVLHADSGALGPGGPAVVRGPAAVAGRRSPSAGLLPTPSWRSSTAPSGSSRLQVEDRCRSWASRSRTGRSPKSTYSPALSAFASSTWYPSTTDRPVQRMPMSAWRWTRWPVIAR